MGRFSVEVELTNGTDLLAARCGGTLPGEVRRERNCGVVRQSALIGGIVMDHLDPIIDCTKQQRVSRDPRHIISEIK